MVDFAGGTEMTGTRDECLDYVERAWWRVETALTHKERVRAADHAARLSFEREDGARRVWDRDVHLTSTIAALHTW